MNTMFVISGSACSDRRDRIVGVVCADDVIAVFAPLVSEWRRAKS